MKTLRLGLSGAVASVLLIAACQRSSHQDINSVNNTKETAVATTSASTARGESAGTGRQRPHTGVCNPYAYWVVLESRTQMPDGNWEWVWSVQNSNPGNGDNGTVQDMSHWGMQFGTCFNPATVISAAYSTNGSNWTGFTPSIEVDPSQGCMTTPLMKFNYGTSSSNKSYYKVVVSADYAVQMVPAYYKSGAYTGCCTFQFEGIGCADEGETK